MKIIRFNELEESFYNYKEYEEVTTISNIIQKVRTEKDKAIIEISNQFNENIKSIEITEDEIQESLKNLPGSTIDAIKRAIKNVKNFALKQLETLSPLEFNIKGSQLGHNLIPIESVGCYVPGGNYPLPSSAIMTVVPAKVAGVKNVFVCSPKANPVTVAAASLAGADRIFRIGGAQAIAAMAFGTETIPKVDKIVGPGNKFVTAAKKEVYGVCGIDFLAGPSEIMIIADDSSVPSYLAADMLSQAEHDQDASAILICISSNISKKVESEIYKQLESLSTKEIAKKALENSFIVNVDSLDQAISIANKKAPEHLQLCFTSAEKYIKAFKNYGSLFVGNYAAEVFGDYCSGTNHVLPTNAVARYSGGLSVFDFVKIQTYQIISKEYAYDCLAPVAAHLANVEGLEAHKNAALLRSLP